MCENSFSRAIFVFFAAGLCLGAWHPNGVFVFFSLVHVSANFACVIPARWSMEDYARHTCDDRSHFHFSRNEFAQHVTDGAVEVLRESNRHLGLRAVVRIVRLPGVGISRRYGEELARMLASEERRMIGQTMLCWKSAGEGKAKAQLRRGRGAKFSAIAVAADRRNRARVAAK